MDRSKLINPHIQDSPESSDSKPHYAMLDGLRGVAAILVIFYHISEGFATSPLDQKVNHGYMAVDFFYILSGFVIGYAYDDRWKKSMTTGGFLKRRLIRLHPMVVFGAVLGAITFCIQGCVKWDGSSVPLTYVLLALLLNLFLIPAIPGSIADVRGNNEMYPLDGPCWSLFFEYIGNIFYALFLRRLSTKWLAALTGTAGIGLAAFAIGNLSGFGHLGVGWSLTDNNLPGGFLRMMFSFPMGLLLSRIFRPVKIKGAFWICSLCLAVLLSLPHLGDNGSLWINGLYESLCIITVFPLLVCIGASGKTSDPVTSGICKFLGDISYPLYIVHYPIMYLFYAWLWSGTEKITFSQAWPVALTVVAASILLSYICLRLYDLPVRRYLAARFLQHKKNNLENA